MEGVQALEPVVVERRPGKSHAELEIALPDTHLSGKVVQDGHGVADALVLALREGNDSAGEAALLLRRIPVGGRDVADLVLEASAESGTLVVALKSQPAFPPRQSLYLNHGGAHVPLRFVHSLMRQARRSDFRRLQGVAPGLWSVCASARFDEESCVTDQVFAGAETTLLIESREEADERLLPRPPTARASRAAGRAPSATAPGSSPPR